MCFTIYVEMFTEYTSIIGYPVLHYSELHLAHVHFKLDLSLSIYLETYVLVNSKYTDLVIKATTHFELH